MSDAPERPTNMTEFQKAIWEIYDLRERIAQLEAERDAAIAEAHATGAEREAHKDRADAAEAEVARLREALEGA